MSYLDVPRLHFAGTFMANPSTTNNDPANYNPALANIGQTSPTSPGLALSWNPYGDHAWTISAQVTSFVDSGGQLHTSGDPLIGARSTSERPPSGLRPKCRSRSSWCPTHCRLPPSSTTISALSFPASVTTGADGSAFISLNASNPSPLPPGREDIGGQIYYLGGSWAVGNVWNAYGAGTFYASPLSVINSRDTVARIRFPYGARSS